MAQRATRSAPFGPPKSLTAVQSTADEGDPWLSPDERVIVFSSSRNGTLDLFEAER